VNLSIELKRGNPAHDEKNRLDESANLLKMGLKNCGFTLNIPTVFKDGDEIVQFLEKDELMIDIENMLLMKLDSRLKNLWKITYLLGISIEASGGMNIFGPQIAELAKMIHLPKAILDTCLDTKSLKPLQAWISNSSGDKIDRTVFIGHGRSPAWRDLKDFIIERLGLHCIEFNSASVAGVVTKDRLEQMLNDSSFAFLVMTAEDMHEDGKGHARENVIHEIGLFQARLGFLRAIALLEDGCEEFSNLAGVGQIRFPKGRILDKSEDIRMVLEREGML